MSRILVTVIAGICFTISTASAGQLEQNINYLARMADGKLHRAAEMSGNIYGLLKRCPALRPSEFGKAVMAVPLLLNEGLDKHLAPPAKFKRAVRVFNGAYRKAVLSKVSCKAGKAKDPDSYQ
ncbi:hypothetical protein [Mesorhizobium sp.]|uniref:hypothetical protein n=1 Tax=Mesorhizobium sp. TaxID=1871066 RepID=UPI000FEA60FA|nr:hypothetical protein [Mesorhizobium sp.]RWK60451.1 MAG: hypothetical protein EOR49_21470 [Mesorhizobium sp.]TJV80686.1 MAG: hypothetical protein E5X84_35785 [Mesorhizobium sp.]